MSSLQEQQQKQEAPYTPPEKGIALDPIGPQAPPAKEGEQQQPPQEQKEASGN